ncbi:MAG: hypothetical protein ACLR60_11995 [Clostridium paraputrificum]
MEIKIRGVEKKTVAFLDERAKAKKISREEFLREQLKIIALDDEIKTIKDRDENLINNLIKVIELNTKVMKAFMEMASITLEEVLENDQD